MNKENEIARFYKLKAMYKLYYMPLNFFCRAARIILIEKNISFKIVNEPYWKRRVEFLKIKSSGHEKKKEFVSLIKRFPKNI